MKSPGPSALQLAARHPSNILYVVAGAVASIALGSPWPVLAALGAAVVWLGVAPRLSGFQKYAGFLQTEALRHDQAAMEQQLLRSVGESERRRFLEVDRLRGDIRQLVEGNASLTMDMMTAELAKVDELATSFLQVASRVCQYESYVASTDLEALQKEVDRQQIITDRADSDAKAVADQNLALLKSRQERSIEVRRLVQNGRAQLNLIDNTMKWLRDQVASMQSPQDIAGPLDELIGNVRSIESAGQETERLLGAMSSALPERH